MSAEALLEKTKVFIANASEEELISLEYFLNNAKYSEQDWWDELPDEVKASIEEGIKEADAGEIVTLDEFKQQYPQWFRM